MASIEKKISPFIRSQFPEIFREDADTLITFIEAYYEWLETTDNTIDYSRSMLDYQNIDKSVDTFINQYKQMYMDSLPLETVVDTKFIIKHIMDLYKSKGSPKSVDLLFRLVFGEGAEIYKPSDDIFTLSDSEYFSPIYIEVTSTNLAKLIQLDGKDIVGSQSTAKAFVEGIATKITNNKIVHVIYLSNVRGNFVTGEQVTDDGLLDGSPRIVGSLSSIIIDNGGANNAIGDTFSIVADVGKQARGRVASIENGTGRVDFSITDGGYGFSTNTTFTPIKVNTAQMVVNNVTNANLSITDFTRFETVVQPLETVAYIAGQDITDNYVIGDYIEGVASDGSTKIANGIIISATTDGANGVLVISPTLGTYGNQDTIVFTGNTTPFETNEPLFEENEVTFNTPSFTGSVVASDFVSGNTSGAYGTVTVSNSTVVIIDTSYGTFSPTEQVEKDGSNYFTFASVVTSNAGATGTITGIVNSTAIVVANIVGDFSTTLDMKGERSNTSATISTVTDDGTNFLFLSGTSTSNGTLSDITISNTDYDSYTNTSVSANLIGTVGTTLGLFGNTSAFNNSQHTFVRGDFSNTYANVSTIATGAGADFKIGTLSDQETVTIYTDFLWQNNTANVTFYDVVLNGSNSGIGVVANVDVTSGGTGFLNSSSVSFTGGGLSGGDPTTNATATVTTDGASVITSINITDGGEGYYTQPSISVTDGSGETLAVNMNFGYGLPLSPTSGIDDILDVVLSRQTSIIGTIESLTNINPGSGYNANPIVSVYSEPIAPFLKYDVDINYNNKVNDFTLGENLLQDISVSGKQLTLTDIANSLPATVSLSNAFTVGEGIVQVVNATVNTYGTISSLDSATEMTIVNIREANATASPTVWTQNSSITFDTTNDILDVYNNSTANVTAVANVSNLVTAKGIIKTITANTLTVRRTSFSSAYDNSTSIRGQTSNATADVINVTENLASNAMGDNAIIDTTVKTANGIVLDMELINSGYGYANGATLTLIPETGDPNIVVTGTAVVETQGVGEGYWGDGKSRTSSDKYIHDNDYYQAYSYEIRSGFSLDKYSDMVKKLLHVAGTKMFGSVIKESENDMDMTVSNSHILVTYANTDTQIYTDDGPE